MENNKQKTAGAEQKIPFAVGLFPPLRDGFSSNLSTDLDAAESHRRQTTARYRQSTPPGNDLPAPYLNNSSGREGIFGFNSSTTITTRAGFDFQSNECVGLVGMKNGGCCVLLLFEAEKKRPTRSIEINRN